MSTATINATSNTGGSLARAIFHRFLWKEYRMLRGFWLAVVVLGVLMQIATSQLMFKESEIPSAMLFLAWGAAALYAVGASVTLFSAESEERTRDFLLNLPGRWLPMFAAKVTLAIVTAGCLGIALCGTGGVVNGGMWASFEDFQNAFSVGGIAVVEATAWGLLFSLLLKQPLLAAVTAIAAASLGAQLAIALTPNAMHTFTTSSYREAVPMRMLLSLAVFAVDVWLGSRWLNLTPAGIALRRRKKASVKTAAKSTIAISTTTESSSRRSMFARLLWQTCRQSWKTMLAAVPIACFLMFACLLTVYVSFDLFNRSGPPLYAVCFLFLPALFGALVFRADQRGDHRQFLVAHASRPRYVWLARHLFWLLALFAVGIVVTIGTWSYASLGLGDALQQIFRGRYHGPLFWGDYFNLHSIESWQVASYVERTTQMALQVTFLGWTAFLTAYATGQFCSLAIRREVLAGFLALLLSIVLATWVIAVGLWQLNPWWFVLPTGIGAVLATWLRMPDWILGRNRLKTWALPMMALVIPFGMVLPTLPSARLDQLKSEPGLEQFRLAIQDFKASSIAGQQTADECMRLSAALEEAESEAERNTLIEQLIQLTKQPVCRFPDTVPLAGRSLRGQAYVLQDALFDTARQFQGERKLDAALEPLLAWMRLKSHLLQGQPTSVVSDDLHVYYRYRDDRIDTVDEAFLYWARHPDQTSELLRKAVTELERCPELVSEPLESVLANWTKIHAILLDKQPPSFFDNQRWGWSNTLAYLANELPWEKQRALQALDIRTKQILDCAMVAINGINAYTQIDAEERRALIGSLSWRKAPMPHQIVYGRDWRVFEQATGNAIQASTSYLMEQELDRRTNIDHFIRQTLISRTRRSGLITQLALLAYQHDHGRYPDMLAQLEPKYLRRLPLDPYSEEPLKYRPQGIDLPILKDRFSYKSKEERTIPPHTPVLWSVGRGNAVPRETWTTITTGDPNSIQPLEEETFEVIRLEPDLDSAIVFPLPKLEPPDDTPADDQAEEDRL